MESTLMQELCKLTKRGKALWFITLLCSTGLLLFGVFGLVTQEKDATAINAEFNADDGETAAADVGILPGEDFSTYFPTNSPTLSPTLSPSAAESINITESHYPTLSPSVETTQEPVASPSVHPSMQTDFPSMEPSQMPSSSTTTLSPSVSPTMPPTNFPIVHPTHAPTTISPTSFPTSSSTSNGSSIPSTSTTNIPTQAPLFPTHDEPNQSVPLFFNYNSSDGSRFGPKNWNLVTGLNSTSNYWQEFGFIDNECRKGAQSPIDVCTQPEKHCQEWHEFRTKVNRELMRICQYYHDIVSYIACVLPYLLILREETSRSVSRQWRNKFCRINSVLS